MRGYAALPNIGSRIVILWALISVLLSLPIQNSLLSPLKMCMPSMSQLLFPFHFAFHKLPLVYVCVLPSLPLLMYSYCSTHGEGWILNRPTTFLWGWNPKGELYHHLKCFILKTGPKSGIELNWTESNSWNFCIPHWSFGQCCMRWLVVDRQALQQKWKEKKGLMLSAKKRNIWFLENHQQLKLIYRIFISPMWNPWVFVNLWPCFPRFIPSLYLFFHISLLPQWRWRRSKLMRWFHR